MSIALYFATLVSCLTEVLLFLAGALAFDLVKAIGEGRVVPPAYDLAREGLGGLGSNVGVAELPDQGGPSAQPQDDGEGNKFCLIGWLISLLPLFYTGF